MNRKYEKEMNSNNNQWAWKKTPKPQMRMVALANTLSLDRWKPEQRIQPHHTRHLLYKNWDDKFVLLKGNTLVAICYAAQKTNTDFC